MSKKNQTECATCGADWAEPGRDECMDCMGYAFEPFRYDECDEVEDSEATQERLIDRVEQSGRAHGEVKVTSSGLRLEVFPYVEPPTSKPEGSTLDALKRLQSDARFLIRTSEGGEYLDSDGAMELLEALVALDMTKEEAL
jgi:hypothetical protein